jgi:hypothetical protein
MNYDTFNVEGKQTIEEYKAGQTMTVNITLTVHHMGHFEFSLCPVPAEAGISSSLCVPYQQKRGVVRWNMTS